MSFDVVDLSPLLGTATLALLFLAVGDRSSTLHRTAYGLAVAATAALYFAWRIEETLFPAGDARTGAWPFIVFAVEILGFFNGFVFLVMMSRAPRLAGPAVEPSTDLGTPAVDIVIPTYDEPRDVVDKAIIAALNQDYPRITVHVLDDGRRDWLQALCAELGAQYHRRADNAHAKAGNLNAALPRLTGDFIAIMDADFAAARNFVSRTLPLFADPGVGIVQTPQVFYNPDVVQLNLGIAKQWVDEQRFFFSEIMPARAQWDAAFSCGSCSLNRRAALDAIGGFPTDSITEDMLTTVRMRKAGYRTVYLNEALSLGLSADSAQAFFVQRERWARGNIQIFFLPADIILNGSLSLAQKLFFAPLYWVTGSAATILTVLVPALYFLFGLAPINGGGVDGALSYAVPFLLMQQGYMVWISNGTYLPLVSPAIQIFQSFRLFPSVLAGLFKPFGTAFRVTPKASGRRTPDMFTAVAIGSVWAATVLGLFMNAFPGLERIPTGDFFPMAVFWAMLTLSGLTVAFWIAIPRPYFRSSERFFLDVDMVLETAGARRVVRVLDMSTGGAGLAPRDGVPPGGSAVLVLPDGTRLAGELIAREGGSALAWATPTPTAYRRLVEFLFSGRFSASPLKADDEAGLYRNLFRRVWE